MRYNAIAAVPLILLGILLANSYLIYSSAAAIGEYLSAYIRYHSSFNFPYD